jgi:hypothetical protein
MAANSLNSAILELPLVVIIPVSFVALSITLIAWTHASTHLRYRLTLHRYLKDAPGPKPPYPPAIPYTLPFLGSALSFLAPRPGLFWQTLFRTHPRETGACTLLLGGQTTHVIFDPLAVQALFKARGLTRDRFNYQVLQKALGIPWDQIRKFYGLGDLPDANKIGRQSGATDTIHQMWREFLVKHESANELTHEFADRFRGYLEADKQLSDGTSIEIGIMEWLRPHMFKASATALLGAGLLEVYPEISTDFWAYDEAMLPLLFGIPHIFIGKEKRALDTAIDGMIRWQTRMLQNCNGKPVDAYSDVGWEPNFGSRVSRARQIFYEERGLTIHARAGIDLGFLFGIASNAIPAAGWMLMHIFDPNADRTVLPRLMKELETVKTADGKLDLSALISLPLIQSIFHETLRLYTDVLVTRDIKTDIVLPFDEDKRHMIFQKGATIMASSYLAHRDKEYWSGPPSNVFYASRFLKADPETNETRFTINGTTGRLFPFGGGEGICPGRVFAKQEVLAAVAVTLLSVDVEGLSYLDNSGNIVGTFPGIRQGYSGAGIMAMAGDIKVRMKKRL